MHVDGVRLHIEKWAGHRKTAKFAESFKDGVPVRAEDVALALVLESANDVLKLFRTEFTATLPLLCAEDFDLRDIKGPRDLTGHRAGMLFDIRKDFLFEIFCSWHREMKGRGSSRRQS
jgi:hypothetical protein